MPSLSFYPISQIILSPFSSLLADELLSEKYSTAEDEKLLVRSGWLRTGLKSELAIFSAIAFVSKHQEDSVLG